MSAETRSKRITIPDIRGRKGVQPIVALTSISAQTARLLDDHVDLMLVGDSLAMVFYGMDSTIGVSLEMMIAHGRAVTRGSKKACVIVDMPFASYQESPVQAFRNAARVMGETRCQGIKLEGGVEMAETVRFLSERGVPVMGHVGLMPQSVNRLGGFKAQGRTEESAAAIVADAKAIAEAGAFAVVVEGVIEPLGRTITEAIDVPTIGIGASPACDGQILVTEDVIGLFDDFTPKFAKRFADVGTMIAEAAAEYAADVRARRFPAKEHCYGLSVKDGGKTGKKRAAG
ncbi:MAG: 3-methyl-2-oxobutanoate hydroxymethyltransferase [Alphaproteobacteria bacterium]